MSKLLVEGELDATLLGAVLKGRPVVVQGGSKNALKPKVEEERRRNPTLTVCYIRDRDFDMDPAADRVQPTTHTSGATGVLGWHWCRHEMENYLLEPAIVTRATGCEETAYRAALLDAARSILHYESARAAVGITRRSLPPYYRFETRPDGAGDDIPRLPANLESGPMTAWAREHAARFRDRICPQLDPSAVERCVEERRSLLTALAGSVDDVLIWFAGKDLMAGLSSWLAAQQLGNPGGFRSKLKAWLMEHPEEALMLLPEWRGLVGVLRA